MIKFAVLAATAVLAALAAGITLVVGAHSTAAAQPAAAAPAAHVHSQEAVATPSYAGASVPDASERAKAREPFPAALPPVPAGDVVNVALTLKDVVVEIAPGVRYSAWGFDGGVPGPVVHVRAGQKVKVTLTNGGAIPHSIDFHAARIAPNVAFADVMPGKSISYTFVAKDAGVYLYHCGTPPVLAHIANGMYGAIVVDPAQPLPKVDHEFALVASEWYLNGPGTEEPASIDMGKARAMTPDWVTWNGYAGQYKDHPLQVDPGDTIRMYVVGAGPSLDTDFHVVGSILDTVYPEGDMHPGRALHGVQTTGIPAGGGAVVELRIDEPGLYPFVSHSFASVDMGQVGLIRVGDVGGTMSH